MGSRRLAPGATLEEDEKREARGLAGVAVPKEHVGRLAYVSEFLDDMKRSGSLQRVIDRAGLRGVTRVLTTAGPGPATLTAATDSVVVVPLTRPATVAVPAGAATVTDRPDGYARTT